MADLQVNGEKKPLDAKFYGTDEREDDDSS